MDYFVIGLGNPGEKYKNTRHNVAWIILSQILSDGWDFDKYLKASYLSRKIADTTLHYVLPQTFMNKSGESVVGLAKMFSSFNHDHLVVIYDDLDLALGTVRISYDRGSGGHNGVKSITEHVGSQKFIRIRVGISKILEDGRLVKPPVLGNFEQQEMELVTGEVSSKVEAMLADIIENGYQKAMNKYN